MDSVKSTSNPSGLVHKFAKALKFRTAGIAPDKVSDNCSDSTVRSEKLDRHDRKFHSQRFDDKNQGQNRDVVEALLAKIFARISSLKAAYAQLQTAQIPYDPDNIQLADKIIVTELKNLSELKHSYLKNQTVPSIQESQLSTEILELRSLVKNYEIATKKYQSQIRSKDSEIISLNEKLQEASQQNKLLEMKLDPNGVLPDTLQLSELNPSHFITVLQSTIRAVRNFTNLMIDKMISAGWDLDAAAASIEPNVVYARPKHKKFAFESFVCQKMISGFQNQNFSLNNEPEQQLQRDHFFSRFIELKSREPLDFLAKAPDSQFGRFCRSKYLNLVHPKMELSFFGDLNHRNLVNSGGIPATAFYGAFLEMAKWVWLLHCFAFSFDPIISIFQVRKGCQFSEVYSESVVRNVVLAEDSPEMRPRVGFTVMPGFKISQTVIQCQVYLSCT